MVVDDATDDDRLGGDDFGGLLRGIESPALELPIERLADRMGDRNESPDSIYWIEYNTVVVTDSMSSPRSGASLLA
jgi:hypothetical protein